MRDTDTCSNQSDNTEFAEVVRSRYSRRSILGGGMAAAAAFAVGGGTTVGVATALRSARPADAATGTPVGVPPIFGVLGFTPIAPSTVDDVVVAPGYTATPFLPWGTPLFSDAPAFDVTNDAAAQARQVGMNHDGMWFFPIWGEDDGVLCINNEYTDDEFLFADGTANWNAAKTAKGQAAVGVTLARVRRQGGQWALVVDDAHNRRITGNTPIRLSGPAAGHRSMRTALDRTGRWVDGTVNNCGMGSTPWGTYLTCEENFNGYFMDLGEGSVDERSRALFDRYGIEAEGSVPWATTDQRWRADLHPNQPNKFGWVVEIDPARPRQDARKRTALGRMKHENAFVVEAADGRVVVYLGDDERGEYVYKYVSDQPWRSYSARNDGPLDNGVLYVARFDADGTGRWMPLVHGEGPLTAANGFADQGDVLIGTRLAADALGATRMDRPEWGSVDPVTHHVYMTMTNNTNRGTERQPVDRANPRAQNRWGHIVRWKEDGDHTALTFAWEVFLLAGPGGGIDGSTNNPDASFGSPDSLRVDRDRRVWIGTDGSQPEGNNQMLAADPVSGDLRRFLVGPPECEITGNAMTPDGTTLWISVQHPGNHDPASSHWPGGGNSRPRSAAVVITKDDGGVIGT